MFPSNDFLACNLCFECSTKLLILISGKLLFAESHSLICAPAAERNKGPILEVLRQFINTSNKGHVLEIASGTGQHVVHFAKFFPSMTFHPSDCDVRHINR